MSVNDLTSHAYCEHIFLSIEKNQLKIFMYSSLDVQCYKPHTLHRIRSVNEGSIMPFNITNVVCICMTLTHVSEHTTRY